MSRASPSARNKRVRRGGHKNKYEESFANGCGARKSVGVQSFWHGAVLEIESADTASVAGQKPTVSFLLFFEIKNLGLDLELACAAT